jgi:hypothetical protein
LGRFVHATVVLTVKEHYDLCARQGQPHFFVQVLKRISVSSQHMTSVRGRNTLAAVSQAKRLSKRGTQVSLYPCQQIDRANLSSISITPFAAQPGLTHSARLCERRGGITAGGKSYRPDVIARLHLVRINRVVLCARCNPTGHNPLVLRLAPRTRSEMTRAQPKSAEPPHQIAARRG